ncbi:hypothetical protein DPSP01_006055 [Paraphaeosphaeria sporulosa]|uniref:Mitochondrial fission process protein 1 n=1 Tax=Paraphaeosphaeria sporulosa TaxID=1460663 RepID=A0A177C9C8_9PLEO|nr:uncharacterized protein CC84DRAFT_1124150 [Paraphaeosphaeria sporulosa]OAG04253.1 hypothetical protein CC84DRAFT_1124150 [Paraphaeosphaeria sporulosa]
MANGDKKPDEVDGVARERQDARPDFSIPPPRKKLPKGLQATLDSDEKMWEVLTDGRAEDSTDTNVRYAAYASRVRTIMMSAHRYVAYTSDIGESFRPVAHPYLVRSAYGISWLYIAGDVANEGYKAYMRNQRILNPETAAETVHGKNIVKKAKSLKDTMTDTARVKAGGSSGEGSSLTGGEVVPGSIPAIEDWRAVAAQRAVFQSVASMGLPALTIHSIVRYSGRAMKNVKNVRLRTWGPIGLGIAAVPALPYMFDEPIEHLTEQIFYHAFKLVGGPKAVEGRPVTGQKELRKAESGVGDSPRPEL